MKLLSDITVYSKYAKYIPNLQRRENWEELVTRNMEMHTKKFPSLEKEIKQKYEYVFTKKVLPSMRSMQFAGKPIEVSPNRIFNCAFCPIDHTKVFSEIMFLLLGGTGVGFSVQKHHVDKLPAIKKLKSKSRRFLVGDSIEGWADAVNALVKAYFKGLSKPKFDFSDIRPKGSLLVTSGGRAPGPQPLKECLLKIDGILSEIEVGSKLTSIQVHDIVCLIASAVLAGGIRRAALISLFDKDDIDMLTCKAGNWYETAGHRQTANNSAVLIRGKDTEEDFRALMERLRVSKYGEPGIYWSNHADWGCNPCCEIALAPYQFCNLTEVNVSDVESQVDLNERVAAAAFIGTLQATYTDFHYLRQCWKDSTESEFLIGVGLTGIGSGKVLDFDLKRAAEVVKGVNGNLALVTGIKAAARTTCVKPSGSTSCVLGTSSGIHAWHNDYYIRRMRFNKDEAIAQYLQKEIPELVVGDKHSAGVVVSIPVKAPQGSILRSEPTLDLLDRIKKVYDQWVAPGHRSGENTNNISATLSVRDDEWDDVINWMWENRNSYNGIAVLAYDGGFYEQAPFEDCTKEVYEFLLNLVSDVNLDYVIESQDNTDLKGEVACAGGACEII